VEPKPLQGTSTCVFIRSSCAAAAGDALRRMLASNQRAVSRSPARLGA